MLLFCPGTIIIPDEPQPDDRVWPLSLDILAKFLRGNVRRRSPPVCLASSKARPMGEYSLAYYIFRFVS